MERVWREGVERVENQYGGVAITGRSIVWRCSKVWPLLGRCGRNGSTTKTVSYIPEKLLF